MTFSNHGVEFACLYTKQKLQKRKTWHDGRLTVQGTLARLYDAEPPPGSSNPSLDACEVPQSQQFTSGQLIEMENFLVTVERPWTGTPATNTVSGATVPPGPRVYNKVLPKFRKPPTRIPPPPLPSQNAVIHRKRLLQPGELQQQYYGHARMLPPTTVVHAEQHGGILQPHASYENVNGGPCICPNSDPPESGDDPRQPRGHFDPPPTSLLAAINPTQPQQAPAPRRQELPLVSCLPPSERMRSIPPVLLPPPTAPMNPVPLQEHTRKRSKALFDKSNGFDPSRFYGEDDEEEEEVVVVGDEEDGHGNEITDSDTLPVWRRRSTGYPPHLPESMCAVSGAIAPSIERQGRPAHDVLTEQELLDLFGVVTSPRTEPASVHPEPTTVAASDAVNPSDIRIRPQGSAPSKPEFGEFTLPSSQSSCDSSDDA